MSSDSEQVSALRNLLVNQTGKEMSVVTVVHRSRPYQDEPLAPPSTKQEDENQDQEVDEDGLTQAILEKIYYLKETPLDDCYRAI